MFAPLIVLLIANGVISHVTPPISKPYYDLDKAEEYFKDFVVKYNKHYASQEETDFRFAAFQESLQRINELNNMSKTATFGINEFTDIPSKELFYSFADLSLRSADCEPFEQVGEAPEEFDWRNQNVITSVKQQGDCGSCWAFATTGAVESQYAIKHQQLLDLSEQQLLDCDTQSSGCDGGLPWHALSYLTSAGGQVAESDYPYQGKEVSCQADTSKVQVRISGCNSQDFQDEDQLKEVLHSNGPLAFGLDGFDVKNYNGGIMDVCASDDINHAVLLVGYGTENGVPYWVVKNSWGTAWGENGFFRIKRGQNTCGMMTEAFSTAVVD